MVCVRKVATSVLGIPHSGQRDSLESNVRLKFATDVVLSPSDGIYV